MSRYDQDGYFIPKAPLICPLCSRAITVDPSKHHLVPVSKGGVNGQTVLLHKICHVKIHSVFTESQLKTKYNQIDLILQSEEIKDFVKWVSNKPSEYYDSSRRTMRRKR